MKQTIIVTGADGQLGQCLKKVAFNNKHFDFLFANSQTLDISNKDSVARFFKTNKAHWCINCAAYTAVDAAESESESAKKANFIGARNLAEICNSHGITLIHISTDFVFDGLKNEAYSERDDTNPINVYGKTKLAGEEAIINNLSKYYIIRTSWLYSEFGSNFLKTMLRLSIDKKELNVVADQIGTPTYAGDLVEVILKIIKNKPNYGVYHYSNEGVASWYDFATAIFEIAQKPIIVFPTKTKKYPTPAKRPKFTILDTAKIKKQLSVTIPYWRSSLEIAIKNLE